MLESLISADSKKKKKSKEEKTPPKRAQSKGLKGRKKSQNKTSAQNLATTLKTAKNELKDREDQLKLLSDMLRSSTHQNSMKDKEIERLKKKLRMFAKSSKTTFEAGGSNLSREKNRTGNTFLPGNLRGSIKAEVGYPMSHKSGRGSMQQKDGLPSIKGARAYTHMSSNDYDYDSQRSQSQVSLAISQKRGEKIVNDSRKKAEALKETPRMFDEGRLAGVEHGARNEEMINLQIQEEDPALEEGTMMFTQNPEGRFEQPVLQDQPEYEDDRRENDYYE